MPKFLQKLPKLLSSSFIVSNFELWNEKRAAQQWNLRVIIDIVLNEARVYHKKVYAEKVVSKFWCVRSFSSQHHSKLIATIATRNVAQVCTENCKTTSFICKVNLKFLSSSSHFNGDTTIALIVSFLDENVHCFNNTRNGSVNTGFQMVNFRRLWKFFNQKPKIFPLWHFGILKGRILPEF